MPTSPAGGIVFFEGFFGSRRGRSFLYHCEPEPGEEQIIELPEVEDDQGNRNLFCAGHAQLADGRWLVVGGSATGAELVEAHDHPHKGSGIRDTWAFLPRARQWRRLADMNPQPGNELRGGGRWYPTCVTLANGRVLAFGGHPVGSGEDMADDYEEHRDAFVEAVEHFRACAKNTAGCDARLVRLVMHC